MRGRRPVGPEIVERLQGSPQARQRLRVILETLQGSRRVQEACQALDIGEVRFNQLRLEALEGALAALEGKPKGRPPRAASPASAAELEQLAEVVESLTRQLQTSQVREEIALAGVRPTTAAEPEKNAVAAEPAVEVTGHQQRLEELVRLREAAGREEARRGPGKQWQQRELEQQVRQAAVEVSSFWQEQGTCWAELAGQLERSPSTLRLWQRQVRYATIRVQPRGRPALRSPLWQRQQVLALLGEMGPGLGVRSLRECFPLVSRAELTDLLSRYRRLWRQRHPRVLQVLEWTQPGTVWALDFTEAPSRIEGRWPYLLAVRDLASGQQLLWQPVAEQTADVVTEALTGLFTTCGVPLVLKSDNGSAFRAGVVGELLGQEQVIPLFSPPYHPQYNGAIEASIGALKVRTERQALLRGQPGSGPGTMGSGRVRKATGCRVRGASVAPARRSAGRHDVR